jgi:HAD superfamily hydrolase (TIGR01509 family)
VLAAAIFDLDGLLLDSEQVWSAAKERLTREHGGTWTGAAEHAMLGMSSPEWARYMRDELGVPLPTDELSRQVVRLVGEAYRSELPVLPGAGEAVARLAERVPLGLASSSNREIIDLALDAAGWSSLFRVSVSSEEVARGKPAPDVYTEAARRLGADPRRTAAIEDSEPGIRSARAAGLGVVAIPNPHYPPDPGTVAAADVVLRSLAELDADAAERAVRRNT